MRQELQAHVVLQKILNVLTKIFQKNKRSTQESGLNQDV